MPKHMLSARAIFDEALEIVSGHERRAYLDEACAAAPEQRQKVEGLLKAYAESGSFLESPPADLQQLFDELQHEAAPETISEVDNDDESLLAFLSPAEDPAHLGRLEHYQALEVIGRGGMGIVLRAFDEKLHRVVAIKVMAPQLACSATSRKRFIREAQAAAAVRNEHVIDIHAVEEANGLPYLVTEYISGVSLQERLDRSGPLPVEEIVRVGMQTARGLAAAHAQGLIHRDIKPANILLENGMEKVKITDFGLARAVDDASLTQRGMVAGTPLYMAPEQARSEPIDHRADLFSLGSVLYTLSTGRPPFHGNDSIAVLRSVCEDQPPWLGDLNPDVPSWLAEIIAQLLEKDPGRRFQSANEVSEVLQRHLAYLQQPAPPPQPASSWREWRRRQRKWLVAAGLLIVFLGGLSLTEATGVTRLMTLVIRLATGEGVLVVEVDDPTIRVTLDGDDVLIKGAGVEEVRLKPGSYRVRALKEGEPIRDELVTIKHGGREVVKVRREGIAAAGYRIGSAARGEESAEQQRLLAEAEAKNRETLKQFPNDAGARWHLAINLVGQDKHAEAEKELRIYLAADPDNLAALGQLTSVLRRQGKLVEAEAEMRRIVAINKDDAFPRYNLGLFLGAVGKLAEAEAELRGFVAAQPNNVLGLDQLAGVLHRQGKRIEGERLQAEAKRLRAESAK